MAAADTATSFLQFKRQAHQTLGTYMTPGAIHRASADLAVARPDEIENFPDHFAKRAAGYSPASTSFLISAITNGLSSR
jgi:hypothetical protein